MKLVRVHGEPVVKFSDDPIKNVCEDASFLQYAAKVFSVGGGLLPKAVAQH